MKYLRVAAVAVGFASWSSVGVAADTPKQDPGDARLERKIEARFERDGKLAGQQLDAQASGGAVTLVGRVATEQDRARAESLARVQGVKTVDNQIEVDDAVTTTKATPATKEAARATERRALSDPNRKNGQVESEPFRTKGSREELLETTGLPDPKQNKHGNTAGD
jgi:hypothetical protein